MAETLISIIIPTYNRAHLIKETLESIIAQTYTQWECIVVDDGSTDETAAVMQLYCTADARFKYYHRPKNRPQGGNAARNFGFEKSKGQYIQWFDSDDLMVPNKLELSLHALKKYALDMVVSKRKALNGNELEEYKYDYSSEDISFESYAIGAVNWFTTDMMIHRQIAKKITFNESLRAGQEYNFSCKLLLYVKKVMKIDTFTTYRRVHEASIGHRRKKDVYHYLETKFHSHWQTYLDTNEKAQNHKFNRYSLLKCTLCYLESSNTIPLPKNFKTEIKRVFRKQYIYFQLACCSNAFLGKYHYFYNKLKTPS